MKENMTEYEELFQYKPELTKREDFDSFWAQTLDEAARIPLDGECKLYDYPSPYVQVYDITYAGFGGTRIHGWYMVPAFLKREKYPCLVHYHGYGGDRGMPSDFLQWILMGVAVLSVDCRGQGGVTRDDSHYSSAQEYAAAAKGVMNKEEYYFRKVYVDCIKAIDFACSMPEVDGDRIIIEGGSQGGALSMAICALDSRPKLCMADVPSNSNLQLRVEGGYGSFSAVTEYLKQYPDHREKALHTLSYFDTMNMADRIHCRVLASVGLVDNICPARHYFATYNRITAPKDIKIYPNSGHEGGGARHNEHKLHFLRQYLE